MINVTVKTQNTYIKEICVEGHANSDEYGHDLVCAIVSGIVTGLCNAIFELCDVEKIVLEEGYVRIDTEYPDENTELVLRTGLIQLQTAEEVNKDFMKIEIMEV